MTITSLGVGHARVFLAFACVLLAAGLSMPSVAQACSCAGPPAAPSEVLQYATAVFEGRVIASRVESRGDRNVTVTELQVIRAWKGVNEERIRLEASAPLYICGRPLPVGSTFLVFAFVSDGMLGPDSVCGNTHAIEYDEAETHGLGTPAVTFSRDNPGRLPPTGGGCAGCDVTSSPAATNGGRAAGALFAACVLFRRRRTPSRH